MRRFLFVLLALALLACLGLAALSVRLERALAAPASPTPGAWLYLFPGGGQGIELAIASVESVSCPGGCYSAQDAQGGRIVFGPWGFAQRERLSSEWWEDQP